MSKATISEEKAAMPIRRIPEGLVDEMADDLLEEEEVEEQLPQKYRKRRRRLVAQIL